jgi:hypothetical protein
MCFVGHTDFAPGADLEAIQIRAHHMRILMNIGIPVPFIHDWMLCTMSAQTHTRVCFSAIRDILTIQETGIQVIHDG